MEILTNSGAVQVNKKTPYGKWLAGYVSTGAWSGAETLRSIWKNFGVKKIKGCTWYAWGQVCGIFVNKCP